jgi:glycolate oxidase FAD binding subunit
VVVDSVRRSFECRVLYDWGGGLLWLAGGEGPDAGAAVIRATVATGGGHATLVRAPADVRNAVEVFQPLAPPLMELTRKLKASFDPAGILNPGRMVAGL